MSGIVPGTLATNCGNTETTYRSFETAVSRWKAIVMSNPSIFHPFPHNKVRRGDALALNLYVTLSAPHLFIHFTPRTMTRDLYLFRNQRRQHGLITSARVDFKIVVPKKRVSGQGSYWTNRAAFDNQDSSKIASSDMSCAEVWSRDWRNRSRKTTYELSGDNSIDFRYEIRHP